MTTYCCGICLSNAIDGRSCENGHLFCESCLTSWRKHRDSCPHCRLSFIDSKIIPIHCGPEFVDEMKIDEQLEEGTQLMRLKRKNQLERIIASFNHEIEEGERRLEMFKQNKNQLKEMEEWKATSIVAKEKYSELKKMFEETKNSARQMEKKLAIVEKENQQLQMRIDELNSSSKDSKTNPNSILFTIMEKENKELREKVQQLKIANETLRCQTSSDTLNSVSIATPIIKTTVQSTELPSIFHEKDTHHSISHLTSTTQINNHFVNDRRLSKKRECRTSEPSPTNHQDKKKKLKFDFVPPSPYIKRYLEKVSNVKNHFHETVTDGTGMSYSNTIKEPSKYSSLHDTLHGCEMSEIEEPKKRVLGYHKLMELTRQRNEEEKRRKKDGGCTPSKSRAAKCLRFVDNPNE
ncbi:hypothetical protein SNEBB_004622 [Seison nebaliae]|nr:hypothetical protein SNEBB_004622 [Seison nebaliae]